MIPYTFCNFYTRSLFRPFIHPFILVTRVLTHPFMHSIFAIVLSSTAVKCENHWSYRIYTHTYICNYVCTPLLEKKVTQSITLNVADGILTPTPTTTHSYMNTLVNMWTDEWMKTKCRCWKEYCLQLESPAGNIPLATLLTPM